MDMDIQATCIKGLRNSMEDTVLIKRDGEESTLLSVFDGHGGSWVAEMCKSKFYDIFKYNVALRNPRASFKSTYKALDDMCTNTPTVGAVAASVFIKGPVMWVANCGDAEVVGISRDYKTAHTLTSRHKVMDETERLIGICNITKSGASDTFRINSTLNIARAIGDHHQPAVISTPEVTSYGLEKYSMLVIASDGLWDVFDAFELRKFMESRTNLDAGYLSEELTRAALLRGSTDNISVIVCKLHAH